MNTTDYSSSIYTQEIEDRSHLKGCRGAEHPHAKLTDETVSKLRTGELSFAQAMKLTGASKVACSKARTGLTWRENPTPPMKPQMTGRRL